MQYCTEGVTWHSFDGTLCAMTHGSPGVPCRAFNEYHFDLPLLFKLFNDFGGGHEELVWEI